MRAPVQRRRRGHDAATIQMHPAQNGRTRGAVEEGSSPDSVPWLVQLRLRGNAILSIRYCGLWLAPFLSSLFDGFFGRAEAIRPRVSLFFLGLPLGPSLRGRPLVTTRPGIHASRTRVARLITTTRTIHTLVHWLSNFVCIQYCT